MVQSDYSASIKTCITGHIKKQTLPTCCSQSFKAFLANYQLDTLSLMYIFILPLYTFQTAQCSLSGDQLY